MARVGHAASTRKVQSVIKKGSVVKGKTGKACARTTSSVSKRCGTVVVQRGTLSGSSSWMAWQKMFIIQDEIETAGALRTLRDMD